MNKVIKIPVLGSLPGKSVGNLCVKLVTYASNSCTLHNFDLISDELAWKCVQV